MRIGFGYDLHRLKEGEGITLGSVFIPCGFSFIAHSDGDVIIHAIIDSILGALAKGDLGSHFPPEEERYRNIRSTELLKIILERYGDLIVKIENVDITVKLDNPRLKAHQDSIKQGIADSLNIDPGRVGFKIKSAEGLQTGIDKIAIEAFCVILIDLRK